MNVVFKVTAFVLFVGCMIQAQATVRIKNVGRIGFTVMEVKKLSDAGRGFRLNPDEGGKVAGNGLIVIKCTPDDMRDSVTGVLKGVEAPADGYNIACIEPTLPTMTVNGHQVDTHFSYPSSR